MSSYCLDVITHEELLKSIDEFTMYYTIKPSSLDNLRYFVEYKCPLADAIIRKINYKLLHDLPLDNDGIKQEIFQCIPSIFGHCFYSHFFYSTFIKDAQEEISLRVPILVEY